MSVFNELRSYRMCTSGEKRKLNCNKMQREAENQYNLSNRNEILAA